LIDPSTRRITVLANPLLALKYITTGWVSVAKSLLAPAARKVSKFGLSTVSTTAMARERSRQAAVGSRPALRWETGQVGGYREGCTADDK